MHAPSHAMPARLQLRFSLLKKNPARLASVRDALSGLDGVESVIVTPATGTVLIQYNGATGNSHRFWDNIEAVLESHHLYHDDREMPRMLKLAGMPVGQLMKRSAMALVGALR